jgi:hypothetical protein
MGKVDNMQEQMDNVSKETEMLRIKRKYSEKIITEINTAFDGIVRGDRAQTRKE